MDGIKEGIFHSFLFNPGLAVKCIIYFDTSTHIEAFNYPIFSISIQLNAIININKAYRKHLTKLYNL